ncbi:hypothetical protein HNY73_015235 [Argiope bruennichi]|uniref:Uncharacterized protein n=1 Tax=Argiope bruennichi TaxID=94029 RepID=A0A8T0ESZ7_ARGBR|nr:hypothetical protein HNY73_015235 [Argiope bruennichi]
MISKACLDWKLGDLQMPLAGPWQMIRGASLQQVGGRHFWRSNPMVAKGVVSIPRWRAYSNVEKRSDNLTGMPLCLRTPHDACSKTNESDRIVKVA